MSAESRCLILGYDRTDGARIAAAWAARELRPEGRLVIVHAARGQHLGASPSRPSRSGAGSGER